MNSISSVKCQLNLTGKEGRIKACFTEHLPISPPSGLGEDNGALGPFLMHGRRTPEAAYVPRGLLVVGEGDVISFNLIATGKSPLTFAHGNNLPPMLRQEIITKCSGLHRKQREKNM